MNQTTPLPADPTAEGRSAEKRPDPAQELLRRWWMGQSPDVRDFLSQAGDLSLDEIVSVLQVDQRARWERGERILAESYLDRYPQVAAEPEIAMDLVYGEFLLREELGETPELDDYVRRFPDHADSIRLQIQFHRAVDESKADAPSGTPTQEEADRPEAPLWSPEGYEILGTLGQGGMGIVYKARQKGLNRIVALKMILLAEHANAEQLTRFRAEAETVAHLQHPNIVQIYEVGKHAGRPYFSLEYVDGGNLAQRIAGNPLPPREAAELIETLARAMEYAHQRGVVHRDLKPANVLIADCGLRIADYQDKESNQGHVPVNQSAIRNPQSAIPKITDFGLAKHLDSGVLQTQSGAILGTPGYMAPEQAAGQTRAAGPAVDIYALGAILYELVTGRPPFQAASILEALELIRHVEPVPPRRLHPKLPLDLETICLKCLEKDPNKRYLSAGALADDLRRFLTGRPILARRIGRIERTWRWCKRNPGWAAMWASVAALLLVVAIGTTLGMASMHEALTTSQKNLDRATTAERDVQKQYFDAILAQAESNYRSQRSGQRFESLRLVSEAAERGRALDLPRERFDELRNVAIAALAMPDLQPKPSWAPFPAGSHDISFDDSLTVCARVDALGYCEICRLVDGKAVVEHRVPGLGKTSGYYVTLSPDGRFVAVSYADGHLQLWHLPNSGPTLWFDATNLQHFEFRGDSKVALLTRKDGRITQYDLSARTQHTLSTGGLGSDIQATLHPSLPLMAVWAYVERDVQIRDARTGAVVQVLPHPNGLYSCAWHPDGRTLATAGTDGPIRLFDTPTGRLLRHFGDVGGGAWLRFNRAGDRLAEVDTWGGRIALWDVVSGRLLCTSRGRSLGPNMRFSADDRQLAAGVIDSGVHFYNVGAGREYRTLVRHLKPAAELYHGIAIHPDGRLAAAAMSDGVVVWDLDSGEEVRFLPTAYAYQILFEPAPSCALLVATSRGLLRAAVNADPSAPGGYRFGVPQQISNISANAMSQSHDGVVLGLGCRTVASNQPFAGAWLKHANRRDPFAPLDRGQDIVTIAVSPNGRWVVTGDLTASVLKVWDAASGEFLKQLPGSGGGALFSPDSRWLATNADDGRLWRVGRTMADWREGPQVGALRSFGFSPDSKHLALTTFSGAIRLFDLEKERDIARLEGNPNTSLAVFHPDGTRLLTTDVKLGVLVWDLRRIRGELTALGQDWEAPPYPPAPPSPSPAASPALCALRAEPSIPLADLPGELLRLSIRRAATPAEACYQRGRLWSRLGIRTLALDDYTAALKIQPDHAGANFYRAEEYLRRRQWAEAIGDLHRAVEHPAYRHQAIFYRALAYLQLGRHHEAEANRELLRGAYPDFAHAYLRGGVLFQKKGDRAMALAYFDAVVHLQPYRVDIANHIAWRLVTGPKEVRDPARALPLAQNAVKQQGDNADYRNTLGVALYRLGRHAEAAACFEKCLTMKPRYPYVDLYFLAMCQQQLGRREEAMQRFMDAEVNRAAHKTLSASLLEEFAMFRAEATALLSSPPAKNQQR